MQITDKELHQKFIKLGNDRRKLTNQLLAILPEIYERKIYKKYAATIEEYAGKFGGLSKGVVKKRLRLEKYLKDKPHLKEAIETEGVHKVALVASLADTNNEIALVDKLKNMSKAAVQELSKELRNKVQKDKTDLNNRINQSLFESNELNQINCKTTLCSAAPQRIKIDLEGDLFFMFLKLKKKYGENLNNQEVMKKIFEENLKHEPEPEKMKENTKKTIIKNSKSNQPQSIKVIPGDKSRYISIHIRRNLLKETTGKCYYPECNRPAEIFHHTDRFANSRSHQSLRPFCEIHHEFAHNGLIENEKLEIQNWQLKLQSEELDRIDQLYREYRKYY